MLLAVLLSLAAHAPRVPKYEPLELHELFVQADLCFTGRIVEVGAETIEVAVQEVGFGEPGGERVRVRRFRDWTCARRWTPYDVGQRCIYFLKKGEGGHRILGAGCEGEAPILILDQVQTGAADAGQAFEGQAIHFRELFAEARRYREHFRFVAAGERWFEHWIEPARGAAEIEAYQGSSRLALYLVTRTYAEAPLGGYRDPAARSPRAGEPGRIDLGVGVAPEALLVVPDLDGDGGADLLVSQPVQRSLSLLRLGAGHELVSVTPVGLGAGSWTGLAPLASEPDGAFRFVAGDASSNSTPMGRLVVFELARSGELGRVGTILAKDRRLLDVAAEGFGDDIEYLGDLDGDGRVEFAVPAGKDSGPGQVWILSLERRGALHAAQRLRLEPEPVGRLRLAAPGDVDGDYVPDLALTSRREEQDWFEGELHVLFLAPDGSVRAERRNLGEFGSATQDAGGLGVFGRSLAAAGDVDRDGVPDLVLEAPNHRLRVLLLARDGSVTRSFLLAAAPAVVDESAQFARAMVLDTGSADPPQLFCSGLGWIERAPNSTWRWGRLYPSLWRFELAEPVALPAGK